MKSYIPLETAAIFFLANLFPTQGISFEYVMVDFIYIYLTCEEQEPTITKWKILAHSRFQTRDFRLRRERANCWAIRADKYWSLKGDRVLPELST